MPIIEKPHFHLLPDTLMAGAFIKGHSKEHMAYYRFCDGTWSADVQHLLGWAREATHSVTDLEPDKCPDWLFGHALRLRQTGPFARLITRMTHPSTMPIYDLSAGTEEQAFNKTKLLTACDEVITSLESADIHIDQWGCNSTGAWQTNLSNHRSDKNPIHKELLKHMTPLEMHTFFSNYGNRYHEEYPPLPPGGPVPSTFKKP
jgi:hypothetical protein